MNLTKRSVKFAAGDRVRVAVAPGDGVYIRVGLTGTISNRSTGVKRSRNDDTPGYLVSFDRQLPLYADFRGNILMYADELEYEDNRDDAIFGEIIAWNLDYVKVTSGAGTSCETQSPYFQLFANYRKGDTAAIIKCIDCGTVLSNDFLMTEQIISFGYLCRYPLTYEDTLRDVNFEVQND